jgi:hypothetical protein
MENKVGLSRIEQFWEWFAQNCQDFGENFDNNVLLDELDSRISQLGDFSWEIGPGKLKENALIISPNGNIGLLPKTKRIIQRAKNCLGWEYYYAKPAKDWNLSFNFETTDNRFIEINVSEWQYSLLRYEDGMFTIIIEAPNLDSLSDTDKLATAEITLDGIMGEELRMQTIREIEVVKEFEKQYQGKDTNIKNLLNHLKYLSREI